MKNKAIKKNKDKIEEYHRTCFGILEIDEKKVKDIMNQCPNVFEELKRS